MVSVYPTPAREREPSGDGVKDMGKWWGSGIDINGSR